MSQTKSSWSFFFLYLPDLVRNFFVINLYNYGQQKKGRFWRVCCLFHFYSVSPYFFSVYLDWDVSFYFFLYGAVYKLCGSWTSVVESYSSSCLMSTNRKPIKFEKYRFWGSFSEKSGTSLYCIRITGWEKFNYSNDKQVILVLERPTWLGYLKHKMRDRASKPFENFCSQKLSVMKLIYNWKDTLSTSM